MSLLYIDEDIEDDVSTLLRELEHDVLTAREAGLSEKRVSDGEQLAFACQTLRAIVTHNRWDFVRLHAKVEAEHFGIIVCSRDNDYQSLAQRIHEAISENEPLKGKLIRVNRVT